MGPAARLMLARVRAPAQAAGRLAALLLCAVLLLPGHSAWAQTKLVVASLEANAPMFKELDAAFVAQYKKTTGRDVRIEQKTAASSSEQVKAVQQGLAVDVVALADPADVDALAETGFVTPNWREQFPQQAMPWATTVAFVVRGGNPKRIRNWSDLARAGVTVVMPDPRVDGLGRDAWLGGWGLARRQQDATDASVARFARRWLANAVPLAADRQAAIDRFVQQGEGDVLLAYESDWPRVEQAVQERGRPQHLLVVPPSSLRVGRPVALVLPVTRKKGSGDLAKAYLNFMYQEAAARIVALQGLRPTAGPPASEAASRYFQKPLRWFSVADLFGSRAKAEQTQFGAQGWFEKIVPRGPSLRPGRPQATAPAKGG